MSLAALCRNARFSAMSGLPALGVTAERCPGCYPRANPLRNRAAVRARRSASPTRRSRREREDQSTKVATIFRGVIIKVEWLCSQQSSSR